MNTELGNHISQSQQMTLTPKMVEELKVLQMTNVELLQYIEAQLNENPLLETEDDVPADYELEETEVSEVDLDVSDYEGQVQKKDFTEYSSKALTLRQHLVLQVRELRIDYSIRKVIFYLIETINDEGYLDTSITDASHILSVTTDKIRKALKILQKLEPAGVGARNLKECILLQLRRRGQLNDTIKVVVMDFLEMLAEKKFKTISQKLGLSLEQVEDIQQKIKSTDPKPGLKYTENPPADYIQPELVAKLIDGKFIVLFNNDSDLNLKVSDYYKRLIKNEESSNETKKYIKSRISKAMEIINAIEQRKRTVLNVASSIIEYQEDFLRKGHMFLKPLTLKMVADKVGLHESTISRTVNKKYIDTPRGVFELKYFFSAQLDSQNERGISANGVKKIIYDMIKNEDKSNPLSDEQMKKSLIEQGISIARRTIAKYRGELGILPASQRKQKTQGDVLSKE